MIWLERVIDTLPADFEALRKEAVLDGHKMLDTLASEWAAGVARFDRPGEVLLAAYADGVLAGIGGLTREPAIPGGLRMRRFYVRIANRRMGVGRALAKALLEPAGSLVITANAAAGSEAFWETLGFVPDGRYGRTHIRR